MNKIVLLSRNFKTGSGHHFNIPELGYKNYNIVFIKQCQLILRQKKQKSTVVNIVY